jgi:hypothetical protein
MHHMSDVLPQDPPAPNTQEPPKRRSLSFTRPSRGAVIAGLVRVIVPVGFAVLAFMLANRSKAELGTIENLIQLALALVAGVATYTIITEYTLERLPGRLAKELSVIEEKLPPLEQRLTEMTNQLAELSGAVAGQLRELIDLHGMEMLFDQGQALEKARRLQDNATLSIDAMWTFLPYDDGLQTYFDETLEEGRPYTRRVVAARHVERDQLLDHIDRTWDRLAANTYEIFLVHDCNYEALVLDRATAALFIYSDRGYSSCFLSSPAKQFVDAVEGLVESLRRPEWRLPIQKGEEKNLAKIGEWLDNYYRSLP